MNTVTNPSPIHREPELLGQTVVVIGGSAGIGFETARRARAEGSKVILTGRNTERLQHAGRSARKTSKPASHHASHRTRGRTGGRGRARRTQYDQHRPHGRNL